MIIVNKNKKKILMFDFDGVIANSLKVTLQCNRIAHCPSLTKREFLKAYDGNFYKTAGKWFKPEKTSEFCALYIKMLDKIPLYKEIPEQLQKLHKNYAMAIITSNGGNAATAFLKKHKLLEYFKYVLGRELGLSKEEKMKFLLSRYKTRPENCLFITDTTGDILEARSCGIKAVALSGGFLPKSRIMKGRPEIYLNTRKMLAKAINNYFQNENQQH